jgi:uncharacterized protein (TIGR03435 family)
MRWIVSAACLLIFSSTGFCQSSPPEFEVASVKLYPTRPETRMFTFGPTEPQVSGRRVTFRAASMQDLVMFAYSLLDQKQMSSPPGINVPREIFEIEAVAPGEGSPGMDQIRLMTQALLTDRFQLKMHRETAILPVYNLVVGKNGSKLKPSAEDSQPSTQNKNAAAAPDGTYDFQLEYTHRPVSELVRLLSGAVRDRVILDKTGLTGFYDFNLQFTANPVDRFGTAQTTAVQEQLGLRLEAAQEPMTVLVIESIQRPSEN